MSCIKAFKDLSISRNPICKKLSLEIFNVLLDAWLVSMIIVKDSDMPTCCNVFFENLQAFEELTSNIREKEGLIFEHEPLKGLIATF